MPEIVVLGVIMVLGLGAYWSMVIFPRQREFQKQQKYVRSLAVGDEMITYGGIIGKVIDIEEEKGIAQVEIADGVVIRILTAALMRPYNPEEIAEGIRKAMGETSSAPQQTSTQ
jgi:preprotein translocase subunit YajC